MRCFAPIILIITFFILSTNVFASKGSDLLFKNIKSSISKQDQEEIYKISGLTLSKSKKSLMVIDDYPEENEKIVDVEIRELDLNNDGTKEVLLIMTGSTNLFGNTGGRVSLFVKNSSGKYKKNLGFEAIDVKVLPTKTKGYSDLQIGGAGIECPVWKWNGSEYDFSHTVDCSQN